MDVTNATGSGCNVKLNVIMGVCRYITWKTVTLLKECIRLFIILIRRYLACSCGKGYISMSYLQQAGEKPVTPSSSPEPPDTTSLPTPEHRPQKWSSCGRGLVLLLLLSAVVIAGLVSVVIFLDTGKNVK